MFSKFRSKRKVPRAVTRVLDEVELPTFPAHTSQALALLRDEDATADDIADVLKTDPGLSIQVLRAVNAAAHGPARTIDNIAHAITLLGRPRVESMLVGTAVRKALPYGSVGMFDATKFWTSSARRGAVAFALAQLVAPPKANLCFTAALLQDLAVPILAHVHRTTYDSVLERWRRACSHAAIERDLYGTDHAELGAFICSYWRLPESLGRAVGAHHSDDVTATPSPVQIVGEMRDRDDEEELDWIANEAASRHGIDADTITAKIRQAWEDSASMAAIFASA